MKKNNIDCSTIVQNVYLKFIKYLGDKMKELLVKENLVKEVTISNNVSLGM